MIVKGKNILGVLQLTNHQIVNEEDVLDKVCPNGSDCNNKCNLINVPNDFHPGTDDSIINF